MSKQLVFPRPTMATKIHLDGTTERLRYGQYEAVMIVKENGWAIDRPQLNIPIHPVVEVECEDGTTLRFDEPFYLTEKKRLKEHWCQEEFCRGTNEAHEELAKILKKEIP